MTERWRKKLEGIDGASPSDDVFERAKEGPMHSDDPLPGPRMSTRVITIVAAFLVFALAISVFAIPALRMSNQAAGRVPCCCRCGRRRPPISSSSCRCEPTAVGARSGAGRRALRSGGHGLVGALRWRCGVLILRRTLPARRAIPPRPSPAATSATAVRSIVALGASVSGSEQLPSATNSAGPSPDGAFRSYSVCSCARPLLLERLPREFVQVYQPLEQGDGQIWAVLQAQGQEMLSVAPGQVVHDGSSVSAGFVIDRGLVPTLGYGSCGQSEASSAYHSPGGSGGAGIQSDVHLTGGCEGEQPGYVWAATSNVSLADTGGGIVDPFAGGRPALASITAAPVTMIFPASTGETTASPSPTPEKSASPTVEPSQWTTFDGGLGFTMELPADWGTTSLADEIVVNAPERGSLHPDQSCERPATGRLDVPVELRRLRKRQPAPLLR